MTRVPLRCLAIVAFACVVPACEAQVEVGGGLAVSAEITGQQYCLGMPSGGIDLKPLPPDAIRLRLMVRLSYRNVSARAMIFLKVADEQIVISHSLADAAHGKNQELIRFRGTLRPYLLEDRETLESQRPTGPFEMLAPAPNGALPFSLIYDLSFPVHDPSKRGPDTELLGKKVFFQLDLNHEMLPKEIARELEVKWRAFGTLWEQRIRTKPIELDIPSAPTASKCESEFRID
jgi:hypothetical protein